jgi:predicted phosphodiesterase
VVQTFDIDAVVDTGDMVDWGSAAETNYVSSIRSVGVPYIYVRGNHDSGIIQSAVGREKNAIVPGQQDHDRRRAHHRRHRRPGVHAGQDHRPARRTPTTRAARW